MQLVQIAGEHGGGERLVVHRAPAARLRALHDTQLVALQDEEVGHSPRAVCGHHELGTSGEAAGELHRGSWHAAVAELSRPPTRTKTARGQPKTEKARYAVVREAVSR